MKKMFMLLLLLISILGLTGCKKDVDEISNFTDEAMDKFLDFSITSDDYCNTYVENSSTEYCIELREATKTEYNSLIDAGGIMTMEYTGLVENTDSSATVNTKISLTVDGVTDIEESEMELVKDDGKWFIIMIEE